MEWNETQSDAFAELLNSGFGQAATVLSGLTGRRVTMAPPKATLSSLDELSTEISQELGGRVACVNQPFEGPISGHALLLMQEAAAKQLAQLLGALEKPDAEIDAMARDAITELGNILLNACLAVFDRGFGVAVVFARPVTTLTLVHEVLAGLPTEGRGQKNRVVRVQTRLALADTNVAGLVVVVPALTAIERINVELQKWGDRFERRI